MRRFLRGGGGRLGLLQQRDENQRADEERGHEVEDIREGHGHRFRPDFAGENGEGAVADLRGIRAGTANVRGDVAQPALRAEVGRGHVLHDAGPVEIRAGVQPGVDAGNADRATQIAHGVEERTGHF